MGAEGLTATWSDLFPSIKMANDQKKKLKIWATGGPGQNLRALNVQMTR